MAKQTARAQWAAHLRKGGGAVAPAAAVPGVKRAFVGTVLGIDPSLRATGLAVVGFEAGGRARWLASETVRPGKAADLPGCCGAIAEAVARLLAQWEPVAVAVEETIYVQNFRTAQKLGAARGAAIGQVARAGVPVFEYSPLRIKQSVAGYGRASKEQVARQMAGLLGEAEALPYDEADAAAAAYCHAITNGRVAS